MSTGLPAGTHGDRSSQAAGAVAALGAVLALTLLVAGIAARPAASSASAIVIPLGLIGLAVIALVAWIRPLVIATLAFALLAVVKFEPAPVDLVFATLMGVSLVVANVRPRVPVVIEGILIALVVVTIASSINAVDTARALTYGGITLYLVLLAVWLTWFFTNERGTRLAVLAYVTMAGLSAAAVIAALYGHVPGGDILLFDPSRGQGLFKDPNVYAAFLVPATAIVFEEIGRPALLPPRRLLTIPLFVLLSGGVVVGFSRAAWLNLAIAVTTIVVVSALRHGGLRVAVRAIAALGIAAVAGFGLLWITGSLTFLQERSRIETYDKDRFGAQNAAFHRMTEHVLGHGPGQVEASLDLSTHSLFARSAFEQGLPGLLLVALLMLATLAYAFVFARRNGRLHGVGSAALLGAWLGMVANSFFIDTIHWRHLYVIAALIWAGYMSQERSSS